MRHVFISYSRKDSDFVDQLEAELNQRGIATWRDKHNIPGGTAWYESIVTGLDNACAMVCVVSANADSSRWVLREQLYGDEREIPRLPVLYAPHRLPFHLIETQPINCAEAVFNVGIGQLAAALKPFQTNAPIPAPTPKPNIDRLREEYLRFLLAEVKADLRDALYVGLQAVPENITKQAAAPALSFGLDIDFDMGFKRLEVEHIKGERFDKAGDDLPDARVPINEMKRVILLGEPGAGKTTTLLQIAVDAARNAESDSSAKLPVFIPLREYNGSLPFHKFVQKHLYNLQDVFADLLHEKRLVFLLDALNEMPRTDSKGRDLLSDVREFLQDKDDWVVSCRVRDYQEELQTLENTGKIRLKSLDPPRIYEVIQRRFRVQFIPDGFSTVEDGDHLWRAMHGTVDLIKAWDLFVQHNKQDVFWTKWPDDLKGDVDYLWRTPGYGSWMRMQGDKRRLLSLCRNPYMLKMVMDLYSLDKSLPDNRGALFKRFVDKLLERDRKLAEQVGAAWLDDALIRVGLAQIAYAMGRETEISRFDAEKILLKHLPDVDLGLLLRLAQGASLLDVGEHVRFTHQLLQEYFSSEVLGMAIDQRIDPIVYWKPENWWQPNGLEETSIILAGVRGDPESVAQWVAPAQPELAYQVLSDSGFGLDLNQLDERTKNALIEGAWAKTNEQNPIGRAAAYRVLGLFDADKRKGVNIIIKDGVKLPDIDWVRIPAGEFTYQDGVMTLDYDYEIARYPVTYVQFQTFLDDAEGYHNAERWFEGLDGGWRNYELREQYFKFSNHPRDAMNWYQTIAFCRWVSWRLDGRYDLDEIDQWAVRLPSEFEWEKAARGNTGWAYPYGDIFDALKCNTSETGIGQTSAVGLFSEGVSPYGVLDMSGNLWEWCLTRHHDPSVNLNDEDLSSSSRRVLRGGAWSYNHERAYVTYRDLNPHYRNNGIGFRLARQIF